MTQTNHKNRILELYCLLAIDLVTIVLSYVFAVLLRFRSFDYLPNIELHYFICLCCMFFSVVLSIMLDWNRNFIKRGYFVEFITLLKYNVIMIFMVSSFLFLMKQAEFFSRLLFGFFFVFNLVFSMIFHSIFKKLLREYLKSEHSKIEVLIVTESHNASSILNTLKISLPVNYHIRGVAFLEQESDFEEIEGIPVVASRDILMEVARQLPLDEVFLYTTDEAPAMISEMIKDFESMGVLCHYSLNITASSVGESSIGKFGQYTVVTYSINFIDYQRRMIKRLIDIIGGLAGTLLMLILTPFIAVAIKMESKGPVFFEQIRIGKNGRRFKIYKFRSMYQDAEERKKDLMNQNEVDGLMFKIKNDPRITKVGRFIRKTSLDEFPQFFNVLKGDMSLVGTRPPTVDEFENYSLYYRRRLSMTPGLTGMWQVSGRSHIDNFDEVVKLDLQYIDEWSLSLDIKILIRTVWVVFTGKGSE